jgi:hypothetical protein
MTRFASILVLALTSSNLVACQATVGVGGAITVPKDAQSTCAGICSGLGMSLGSVVIMASNVGCVCDPKGTPSAHAGSSSASGGMAAIMIAEEAERQEQQQLLQPAANH